MRMAGSCCTSAPPRSVAISASALLMMISSRASSSVLSASASSYRRSASSNFSLRTSAIASWRSASERISAALDIVVPALHPILVPRLLPALEFDEALHFFLCGRTQCLEFLDDRFSPVRLVEEIPDAQIERLQDLQERIQANLILSLLHPGKVGLVNSDPVGKLHLGELSL